MKIEEGKGIINYKIQEYALKKRNVTRKRVRRIQDSKLMFISSVGRWLQWYDLCLSFKCQIYIIYFSFMNGTLHNKKCHCHLVTCLLEILFKIL